MRGLDCLDYCTLVVVLIVITTYAQSGKHSVLFAQQLSVSGYRRAQFTWRHCFFASVVADAVQCE